MSLNTVFPDHHCTYIVSTVGGHESGRSWYLHSVYRESKYMSLVFNTVFPDRFWTYSVHMVVVLT